MKRKVRGKWYDTTKASLLFEYDNGLYPDDFNYVSGDLYITPEGEYFLDAEGGAFTRYAVHVGRGWMRGSEKIIPMSKEEAREWASDRFTPEEVNKMFSQPRSHSL